MPVEAFAEPGEQAPAKTGQENQKRDDQEHIHKELPVVINTLSTGDDNGAGHAM